MMHNSHIVFYEISIAQVMVDMRAIRQIAGLEMQMDGNAELAAIFAPSSAIGARLPASRMLMCDSCFMEMDKPPMLPALWQKASDLEAERQDKKVQATKAREQVDHG